MRIIHLTDPHLLPEEGATLSGVDTFVSLQAALRKANELNPSAFCITGDIADDGSERAYQRLVNLFQNVVAPVFVTPGNHDSPTAMKRAFSGTNIQCIQEAVFEDCHFVFLNSHVPGQSHGSIAPDELRFLKDVLTRPQTASLPLVLSLHHPLHSPCADAGCHLINADEVLQLLSLCKVPGVVLSGHLHLDSSATQNFVQVFTTPSTFGRWEHPERIGSPHQLHTHHQGFRIVDFGAAEQFTSEVVWLATKS
jgi:3',5'-cyclic-AMP phosphodiesterase